RAPARVVRRAADEPAGTAVRGAPRGPVRHDHHVCRPGHGRHGHLGEPAPRGLRRRGGHGLMPDIDFTSLFPDEVVTKAHVRFVELPLGAGRAGLITLDNGHDHTKPNTLGPASLLELERAIDAAHAEPGVVAVAVTG